MTRSRAISACLMLLSSSAIFLRNVNLEKGQVVLRRLTSRPRLFQRQLVRRNAFFFRLREVFLLEQDAGPLELLLGSLEFLLGERDPGVMLLQGVGQLLLLVLLRLSLGEAKIELGLVDVALGLVLHDGQVFAALDEGRLGVLNADFLVDLRILKLARVQLTSRSPC